eukprot:TRINITY_DN2790_c0_g1_i1.p1 TRINITY_DN2790_c0_g1~~TRINITY_DN2790_c0_g1_i1.p1  ORF type:complete len:269 (-),score=103.15 TRINITY_DN2790_c0_g1_i1:104-910(-)
MPSKRKTKEEKEGITSPSPDKQQKKKSKPSPSPSKGKSKKEAIVVEEEPEIEFNEENENNESAIILDDIPTEDEQKFEKELEETAKKYPGSSIFLTQTWDEIQSDPLVRPTLEELRKLDYILVPQKFEDFNDSVYQKLDEAVDGLIILNTTSSHIMHDFFNKELQNFVKMWKSPDKHDEAFSYLFAITVIAKEMDHWYVDYEEVRAINNLMNSFHSRWKEVFTKTDEELGLKGENSRNKLMKYLIKFANSVHEANESYDDKPKFQWFK